LFPTFENWEGKNIWDKLLSVVSAPSIFLLAITLPVVETEQKEDDEELELDQARERESRSRSAAHQSLAGEVPYTDNEPEPEWINYRRHSSVLLTPGVEPAVRGLAGHGNAASIAISTEDLHHHNPHSMPLPPKNTNPAQDYFIRAESTLPAPVDWNRWLVVVQIFTAPVFVSLVLWGNLYHDDLQPKPLFKMILYGLVGSLVTLAILTVTTRHDRVPKYRHLFCFLGFVVSIAWISTIANEVVGVLKAFGVIVGISDAILGLTIFAVGNSLGDLVADITVARLGYPVMALSACFGGPMLNILLGIGGSGLYMTLTEAHNKHEKHPGRPMKYKPYEIDISPTLLISAVSLLITLVALLILVPLNKWMMTRRIGYGLITLWVVSTIANLVVEITGVWGDHSSF
jgi:sodium/potassium/calcium exchanger 6